MAIIVVNKRLLGKGFNGLTIAPFIILRDELLKDDKRLMNHERIHIKQQVEMLWLPFFIWYGIEFLIKRFKFKDAYRNLSFEREAYSNQYNENYLNNRPWYAWYKRINK